MTSFSLLAATLKVISQVGDELLGAIPTTRNYPAISTNEASAIFG